MDKKRVKKIVFRHYKVTMEKISVGLGLKCKGSVKIEVKKIMHNLI